MDAACTAFAPGSPPINCGRPLDMMPSQAGERAFQLLLNRQNFGKVVLTIPSQLVCRGRGFVGAGRPRTLVLLCLNHPPPHAHAVVLVCTSFPLIFLLANRTPPHASEAE